MDLSHLEPSGSRSQPATKTPKSRSLARRASIGMFRGLSAGFRSISNMPPGRYMRRRLLASIHYAKKGVQIADQRFEGLSIVFLTDLHAGHVLSSDDLVKIFGHINDQKPDLICFGGDMIDARPQEMDLLRRPLAMLRPRLGMYAVAGNHEYQAFDRIERFYAILKECGVTPLHNSGVRIKTGSSSIWLGGVDDATEGEPSVSAALEGREEGEPTVLLSHHPDVFPIAEKRGVDLQLSGHTHGGQISLLGWKPLKHSKRGYVAGAYWRGSSALYVSKGVGVTALPFRIGVSAEVPLFDLRPATQEAHDDWCNRDFEVLSPAGNGVPDAPGTAVFLGLEEPESPLPAKKVEEEVSEPSFHDSAQ
ncbi:MAG: putative MPP superfamily phosphohydrolase [Planctomycetota bacterium]|jgi:predicted MPP superfamily phosphohydrolase